MPDVTVGAYSFRGEQIYGREYPAGQLCSGRGYFNLLIYHLAVDSPLVAEGSAPLRVQGVGGYFLAAVCPDQDEVIFELHYQTLAMLRDGNDGRDAPEFRPIQAAIEDAMRQLAVA